VASEVKLPRLGQGMESGTIVRWLKAEGEQVAKGEPLYELDTDKVTQEVEAEASGVLLRISVAEGEVPVGQTIAVIGEAGEDLPAESSNGASASVETPAPAAARPDPVEPASVPPAGPAGGRVKASPLARRIARERGIDLAELTGTGPDGRVVAEDVERAAVAPVPAAAAAPAEGIEIQPLSSVRRTIARRLTQAWEAPAFQISMSADMTRTLALRKQLVERGGYDAKPTVTDVLTKACGVALMRHRAVNALYAGDSIELHPSANVGIAVAIDQGLVVPVIPGCERLTILEIAAARAELVGRARAGKLQQADLAGGTFTISNLGMFGVETFVAVLNPPQAAILAVGAIEDRPVARDGALAVAPLMSLTLTCDHRALDGATAAEFLRSVKDFLEEPGLML
jgi:pyruvate dehydrogenase E2 component (dihydrolipoamide acetyltransferase)